MAKFKEYEVKPEPQHDTRRVVKVEKAPERVIREFALQKIRKPGEGDYTHTKAKYGALAATDAERQARVTKDKNFTLSPLLKDPLAIEQEERRAIEERVKAAVQEMGEKARAKATQEGYQAGLEKGY